MPAAQPVLPVESAEGVRLRLTDGLELVDGMSSWWSAIHGYRNPVLDEANKTANLAVELLSSLFGQRII